MTTYVEAVTAAGRVFNLARLERDSLPPRIAAEAAHEPGGITLDEREHLIRAQRSLPEMSAA